MAGPSSAVIPAIFLILSLTHGICAIPMVPAPVVSVPVICASVAPASVAPASVAPASVAPTPVVPAVCKASKDPVRCGATLAGSSQKVASGATPLEAIRSIVSICSNKLSVIKAKTQEIRDRATGEPPNSNLTAAVEIGLDTITECSNRINQTANMIDMILAPEGREGKTKDLRAWMSAALGHEFNVWSGYQKFVNISLAASKTSGLLDSLMAVNIDALSMLRNYDLFGNNMMAWGVPDSERDGFFEDDSLSGADFTFWKLANDQEDHDGRHRFGSKFEGGIPVRSLKPDVTVCSRGCDYKSIQEAVNAAPDHLVHLRFVIYIKAGVYAEKVRVHMEKTNLVFLGDGIGKTIITGKDSVAMPGMSTFESSTVGVIGDRFMARGITVENTAGSEGQQVVAFRSDSDLSVIENCEFIANQDTLYAKTARQYYKSCRIVGNIDFIFGNSASYFQDCEILVAPRTIDPEKGYQNPITAHGRTDPGQTTGFVFEDCMISGTKEYNAIYQKNPIVHKNYLARPWKEFSKTIFIRCVIDSLIDPEGYMPWNTSDYASKTLYYGEYDNFGAGANTAKRVPWSSVIAPERVGSFSVQNFLQGNVWIPTIL